MKNTVIGILAHVDSGKTTLSESLLYKTGEIRKLGRVDHKNAFLDTDSIERDKGITIFSKQAVFNYENTCFTLLDTPGHVDFSAETERVLWVLDYAILVISGTDGVQSHTETLWQLLESYKIPTFVFVNKTDISAYSKEALLSNIKGKLNGNFVDFSSNHDRDEFYENIAVCDEELMQELFNDGTIKSSSIAKNIKKRNIFPCFFGSALKLEGIDSLLLGLDKYTADNETNSGFGARVFKISEDEQKNRLTHLKITGGELKVKDVIEQSGGEKVNQIRIYSGEKYKMTDKVLSGCVCTVTGLTQTYPGMGLGTESDSSLPTLEPVLTYSVIIPENCDIHKMLGILRQLEEEDPQLKVVLNNRRDEILVQIMGEVQLEVLTKIIKERFNLDVAFGKGSISYKETIAEAVEGIGHYEPLRHYAEVHILLEPGERGSGVVFATDCSEDELDRNWQRLIMTHLKEKVYTGVLTASPITDIKLTLVSGRAHAKHTEGGDFRQATYRAVMQGLKSTKSILLEPWYDFTLTVPTECAGRAMTDIIQMGGEISQPDTKEGLSVLKGSAPVANMQDYPLEVVGYTKGMGNLSCSLKGYYPCHNTDEVIEQIGYDHDHDTENTADSVFCSHGAGFTVKWDKVKDYMHIECKYKNSTAAPVSATASKLGSRISQPLNDDELLKIFEKAYGPVKTSTHKVFKTQKATPSKASKPVKIEKKPDFLLVDGYNIIFAWDELKALAEESLDLARQTLINIMCNYQAFKGYGTIVVFDAYKVKNNPGEIEKIRDLHVVYTKEAETADMYIEKTTHELAKNFNVKVATSDGLEQLIILGKGAQRISATEFHEDVKRTEEEINSFIN